MLKDFFLILLGAGGAVSFAMGDYCIGACLWASIFFFLADK